MVRYEHVADWSRMRTREFTDVNSVVVHRIEVSQEDPSYSDTAAGVARFFAEHEVGRQATGGQMPYPILIAADGSVVQTLPLDRVAPHARSHNVSGIGVGCLGDFREREPPAAQLNALVEVCASLCRSFTIKPDAVSGHDELIDASHDPDKECPGRTISMDGLRSRVAEAMTDGAKLRFCWDRTDVEHATGSG